MHSCSTTLGLGGSAQPPHACHTQEARCAPPIQAPHAIASIWCPLNKTTPVLIAFWPQEGLEHHAAQAAASVRPRSGPALRNMLTGRRPK